MRNRQPWLQWVVAVGFVALFYWVFLNAVTKPSHRKTYLALGDSYTICERVEENERWPNQLAEKCALAPPMLIAKTGWTTDELNAAIDAEKIDGKTFDLVTLLIGVNNQYRGRTPESFRPEFVGLLIRAVRFARGDKHRVIVVSIPDWSVMPFAAGRDLAKIAAEIDAFNAVCREEAKRADVAFVDITPNSREAVNDSSLVASDGLHPSGKQYKRWVDEQIAPLLSRILSASKK